MSINSPALSNLKQHLVSSFRPKKASTLNQIDHKTLEANSLIDQIFAKKNSLYTSSNNCQRKDLDDLSKTAKRCQEKILTLQKQAKKVTTNAKEAEEINAQISEQVEILGAINTVLAKKQDIYSYANQNHSQYLEATTTNNVAGMDLVDTNGQSINAALKQIDSAISLCKFGSKAQEAKNEALDAMKILYGG